MLWGESADSRICCSTWSIKMSATKLDRRQLIGTPSESLYFCPLNTQILLPRQTLIKDENSLIISGWMFFFCSEAVINWIDWVLEFPNFSQKLESSCSNLKLEFNFDITAFFVALLLAAAALAASDGPTARLQQLV